MQNRLRRRAAAHCHAPPPVGLETDRALGACAGRGFLAIVVSLSVLFPPRPEIKKISQIRTEFSIPEKNIKIVWVQRDDFHMPETKG